MKATLPTFGAYAVAYNILNSGYPWKECIRNALTFCNKFYILDGNSDDGTFEALQNEFKNTPGVVLKRAKEPWDFNDTCIVGKRKQEAREMVKENFCVYLDLDEILLCRNQKALYDMVLHNTGFDVFSLPYITFFGDVSKIANFKEAENFWRWKIFRNKPYIGHGAHGASRRYDADGRLYIDKTISDGCEIINLETLEIMPNTLFAPPMYVQAGQVYRTSPQDDLTKNRLGAVFSEVINDFPLVCLHYGWLDFEKKAKNGLAYWTKTKAFKDGKVEHSRLFDGLTEDINKKIKEWKKIDTIPLLVREQPDIIRPYIANMLKPKVLSVSLASAGPYGVPKWASQLRSELSDYDVQLLAFEDFVSQAPAEALEYQKAQSFIQHIQKLGLDKHALTIFADGFWASTYTGPAKVISVIHGLWSHPVRDKWDDGLLEQRKELFRYQMEYYRKAKLMGHTLICVSPFIHKILNDEYGVESILIPNSIDLAKYDKIVQTINTKKSKPIILHGITSKNKGSDILNEFKNHPEIKDRFDVWSVDEIAERYGVPKENVFKIADLAFMPTKWEASSFLLLECLANNLPLVAHRAGILNCTELKHINNIGVITDNYTMDDFIKGVNEVYANPLKYLMGRLFIKDNGFTLDAWKKRIASLIYEVM